MGGQRHVTSGLTLRMISGTHRGEEWVNSQYKSAKLKIHNMCKTASGNTAKRVAEVSSCTSVNEQASEEQRHKFLHELLVRSNVPK